MLYVERAIESPQDLAFLRQPGRRQSSSMNWTITKLIVESQPAVRFIDVDKESIVPQLIYDVGAHEGQDTAFYLKKGFKVVAIEASPQLSAKLSEKFSD